MLSLFVGHASQERTGRFDWSGPRLVHSPRPAARARRLVRQRHPGTL